MITNLKLFFLVVVMAFLSGCIFYSNPQVNYYDINQIKSAELDLSPLPATIGFRQFRNLTPVGNNFIYSSNNGKQIIDNNNLWIQSPEQMIQRQVVGLLEGGNNNSKVFDISATLYDFAINPDAQTCTVALKFNVKATLDNSKVQECEYRYHLTQEVVADNAGDYTVAMAKIIAEITAEFHKELKSFLE